MEVSGTIISSEAEKFKMPRATPEQIREALDYDPETGIFTWRANRSFPPKAVHRAGDRAGYMASDGYWRINVGQTKRRASLMAWVWMTGEWPPVGIDHKNRNVADDRWENLRLADKQQNAANMAMRSSNTCGFKGVRRMRGRWSARIMVDRKERWLGMFDTPEAAHEAYIRAAKAYFGEYARAA